MDDQRTSETIKVEATAMSVVPADRLHQRKKRRRKFRRGERDEPVGSVRLAPDDGELVGVR
jgi:CelD/BcsL family acetyltransferase involved in cellulose biosynthesis